MQGVENRMYTSKEEISRNIQRKGDKVIGSMESDEIKNPLSSTEKERDHSANGEVEPLQQNDRANLQHLQDDGLTTSKGERYISRNTEVNKFSSTKSSAGKESDELNLRSDRLSGEKDKPRSVQKLSSRNTSTHGLASNSKHNRKRSEASIGFEDEKNSGLGFPDSIHGKEGQPMKINPSQNTATSTLVNPEQNPNLKDRNSNSSDFKTDINYRLMGTKYEDVHDDHLEDAEPFFPNNVSKHTIERSFNAGRNSTTQINVV